MKYTHTIQELISLASINPQHPWNFTATHHEQTKHGYMESMHCPQCKELRKMMSEEFHAGVRDAKVLLDTLKDEYVRLEAQNAFTAWESVNTEPALSYLAGYCSEMEDI